MSEWLPYLLTIIGSIVGSYLVFWIRFERFQSMDIQRERDWLLWRGNTDKAIERIDNRVRDHERFCDQRWNEMNSTVGELRGRLTREEQR